MFTCNVCVSHSVTSNSATPWTAAHQAPPSMELSRQEYWSGVPLPPPIYKGLENLYGLFYLHSLWPLLRYAVLTQMPPETTAEKAYLSSKLLKQPQQHR